MRLQILPLPEVVLGEAVKTPFVLVIDELPEGDPAQYDALHLDQAAKSLGAEGILVFTERVEVV